MSNTSVFRAPLWAAGLCVAATMAACGGGDEPALAADSSGDLVAKFIGTWESACYADGAASARLRADFSKTSPTSFGGDVATHVYLGKSCWGSPVKSKNVLSDLAMQHAGTKVIEGVTADKFNGSSSQGKGKLVLYVDGSSLRLGNVDGAQDAQGYAQTFVASRYTLKRSD